LSRREGTLEGKSKKYIVEKGRSTRGKEQEVHGAEQGY